MIHSWGNQNQDPLATKQRTIPTYCRTAKVKTSFTSSSY